MRKTFFITILMFLCVAVQIASAQKFGYVNSAALLSELPEVKAADSELTVLQNQLKKKGEDMVTAFQQKYTEISTKEKNGEFSPKQIEVESQKLKEEETRISQFEQESSQTLAKKREELLKPILDRVNKAISDTATENGFSYVFDASANILLYADATADVTPLVKKKLGL